MVGGPRVCHAQRRATEPLLKREGAVGPGVTEMRPKRFLLLLTALATLGILKLEVNAASIRTVPNPTETSPEALDACEELKRPKDLYYQHDGLCCKKCPPGFQVNQHCTSSSYTTCRPCEKYTYVKHHNALRKCFSCTVCRQLDQLETQLCTTTNDTQCSCKDGSFCSPEHACETCQKCKLRCPEGEEKVRACTPTSDIQCQPSTTPPSSAAAGSNLWHLLWILLLLVLGLGLILALKFRKHADGEQQPRVTWPGFKKAQGLLGCYPRGQPGRRDNEQNERVDVPFFAPSTNSTPSGSEVPGRMPQQDMALTEEHCGRSAEGERHLIPANGKDPTDALRESFETFIKKVPVKQWRRYMRALHLTDNEIVRVERSEKEVDEQQFQMLQTWLEKGGREVTLHTLLNTLSALELRGIEKEVREALISQGLYLYQE